MASFTEYNYSEILIVCILTVATNLGLVFLFSLTVSVLLEVFRPFTLKKKLLLECS